MKNEFQIYQTTAIGGEAASASASASIDEAYFNGIYAGLSFRSLLATGLKSPETESLFPIDGGAAVEAPLYNFFSETPPPSLSHQLPGLLSYEPPRHAVATDFPAPNPRSEADPSGKQQRRPRRRQPCRLSDKTHCLRKLLPGDEKMDMATVLEEAYKYIRFLQSQVSALQAMPCQSSAASEGGGAAASAVGGDLPRLNRQQLLQVVTNSPAVQAQLCAEGCCVYAAEQLLLMRKIAEQNALIDQQMMYGSFNPNLFHA